MKKPSIFESLACFSRKRRESKPPQLHPRPIGSLTSNGTSVKTNSTRQSREEPVHSDHEEDYIVDLVPEKNRKEPIRKTISGLSTSTYIEGPTYITGPVGRLSNRESQKMSMKSTATYFEPKFEDQTTKPKRHPVSNQLSVEDNVFENDDVSSLYWT